MIDRPSRLKSIDVFRAVTMLLMVFVNDVDGVRSIPEWIKHAQADEDALGFADTIFPAFLFIVGLSIPFAISNRLQRGESFSKLIFYLLTRSISLLIMGFIHVNLEHYSKEAVLPKAVWEILVTLSFFLIWLDYPKKMNNSRKYILQGSGWVILISMCFLFRGEEDGEQLSLRPYWWGILGLIGWSYLISSIVYLFSRGRLWVLIALAIFFFLFDLAVNLGWIQNALGIRKYIWIVGNGSMPAFTMAGVVLAVWYARLNSKDRLATFWWVASLIGIALIGIGCAVRPFSGISKIHATPSWVGICTGISFLAFVCLAWIVDVKGKLNWFQLILPAGTSTLTCYLIPYFLYSIFELMHFRYPSFLNEGWGGLVRSVIIAFLVVLLTGWLQRRRICIKA